VKFLCDENFNGRILRGLKRRKPDLDVVIGQDVGLSGQKDPPVLEWAATQGRITLTHDVRTMPKFARERIRDGKYLPGLIVVPEQMPIGEAVRDLMIVVECSEANEWENRIEYLPL
jgi:hypothetical protein